MSEEVIGAARHDEQAAKLALDLAQAAVEKDGKPNLEFRSFLGLLLEVAIDLDMAAVQAEFQSNSDEDEPRRCRMYVSVVDDSSAQELPCSSHKAGVGGGQNAHYFGNCYSVV